MDGLSAAASVVGVISLAMQLGQAARSLIAFLDTITDAPKEVARLKDLLLQIAAICSGVRSAFEYQSRLRGYTVPGADDIYDALLVCQRKLVAIQEVLDRVEDVRTGRTLVMRNWAKFKLAVKKDDLLELERQLGQALAVLNVLLTTNLLNCTTRSALVIVDKIDALTPQGFRRDPVPSQLSDGKEATDATPASADDGRTASLQNTAVLHWEKPSQNYSVSVSRAWHTYRWRAGSLSIQTDKKRRAYQDDGHANGYETYTTSTTYMFRSTFLSRSIEIMTVSSGGSNPHFSLRLKNRMQPGVWDTVLSLMKDDDVRGLQNLFSQRLVTIDMDSPLGWSLSEEAQWRDSQKIMNFVRQQGCSVGWRSPIICLVRESRQRNTKSRFKDICDQIDLSEYDPSYLIPVKRTTILKFSKEPVWDAIEYLALVGPRRSFSPLQDYLDSLLCSLCSHWCGIDSEGKTGAAVAKTLINGGANLHHLDLEGRTPLYNLLAEECSAVVNVRLATWTQLLSSCGVNVAKYISEEDTIYPHGFDYNLDKDQDPYRYTCSRPWKFTLPLVSPGLVPQMARSMVQPESPALMVLEEFNFCPELKIEAGNYCSGLTHLVNRWRNDDIFMRDQSSSDVSILLRRWVKLSEHRLAARGNKEDGEGNIQSNNSTAQKHISDSRRPRPEDIEYWKTLEQGLCKCDLFNHYIDLWPFYGGTHTICQSGSKLKKSCLGSHDNFWCWEHRCRFNHERFARKQEKKIAKRMGAKGGALLSPVMPGTWVD